MEDVEEKPSKLAKVLPRIGLVLLFGPIALFVVFGIMNSGKGGAGTAALGFVLFLPLMLIGFAMIVVAAVMRVK